MLCSLFHLLSAFAVVISVSAVSLSDLSTFSGAAYIITNDPTGNQILAINIAADGTLGEVTATSAGGVGSGCNCTNATSPLNSQGSIETHAVKKFALTVNAGSDTLSMFKIDPENPVKLSMVGGPVYSGGNFPISVAINDQGTMACVLNGGQLNGVNCYKPHLKRGLIPIPNTLRSLGLNLTTPPVIPGTPSQLIFSEDGQTLIAAVKASLTGVPGFLAAWAIESDGSLSAELVKSSAGFTAPFSTTLIPGTFAILVSDAALGYDIFNFGTKNSLSASASFFPIPGQLATCWSKLGPKSGNFYLTDPLTAILDEVNVDKNLQGTLVRQYQQPANSLPADIDIASVGPSDFLYVLNPGILTIDVLDVSTAGNAITVQTFDITSAAKKVGVTPNANFVEGMSTFVHY